VGQRRSLSEQGLGSEIHDTIAQDAVDDAAISNSPRIPSHGEVVELLRLVG
jgi:alcohol dehydrogenase class IV